MLKITCGVGVAYPIPKAIVFVNEVIVIEGPIFTKTALILSFLLLIYLLFVQHSIKINASSTPTPRTL